MAEQTGDFPAMATKILGVCVVYCDGQDKKEVWLNINAVQAIAWGTGEVSGRGANPNHGNQKIPTGPQPGPCPPNPDVGGAPICWWTGSAWVCGEA
jgi:hypothetical protein